MSRIIIKRRPEAVVEVNILREIGRIQRLSLFVPSTSTSPHAHLTMAKNEVGVGYRKSLLPALQAALRPFGQEVVAAAITALQQHHITYGLGVGSPDLVGSVMGRRCDFEVKTEDGVVSDDQKAWHAAERARGVFIAVVRGPDDVLPALERCVAGEVE